MQDVVRFPQGSKSELVTRRNVLSGATTLAAGVAWAPLAATPAAAAPDGTSAQRPRLANAAGR